MRFALSLSLLAMRCITPVYSLAIDASLTIEGKPMPDKWIRYDLTPVNTTSTAVSLTPRTDVDVCEIIRTTASCLTIVKILSGFVASAAASIKSVSNDGSCAKISGSFEGISWVYYATGRNCDTTAEASTIQGALKHHLETVDGSQVCGTECLDLTHSGTWNGYLLFGPTSNFNSAAYCGPTLPYSKCTSGGKNDL
ncbi:uncharacterized protein EAF02_005343 [Botrytis sinoallii]|uniref:uncharacterized protein n=1 Tax=Botrytis sinoallii TaxID=1463999 RepID=UPI00190110BC|nr:uncharacterized protein EAF02_005343 [Botrytis sinoallii]KAF7883423.1 hypothetical protein EAF02_005343 [Botrytis sinoallii]